MFRYAAGDPEWEAMGLPTASADRLDREATVSHENATLTLFGWALTWTLLAVFARRMALDLTPCIYPTIPITVSCFGVAARRDGEYQITENENVFFSAASVEP